MADPLVSSCEIISSCLEAAELPQGSRFWDVKAKLTAIGIAASLLGIAASLGWQVFSYRTSKTQRAADRKWTMFKEEIYAPFLALLDTFEEQVKPSMLPTILQAQDIETLQDSVGKYSATLSEVELLCQRADLHQYANSKNFQERFKQLSDNLNVSLGKLLSGNMKDIEQYKAVGAAYSALIQGLRDDMGQERQAIDT